MAIELNHTIVASRDRRAAAQFVADVLGRPAPVPFGPFAVVELDNGVSLDFADFMDEVVEQHYAFLITEDEFDAVAARLRERGVDDLRRPRARDAGPQHQRRRPRSLLLLARRPQPGGDHPPVRQRWVRPAHSVPCR